LEKTMAFISRIQGSGISGGAAGSIAGDVATGITAAGSTAGTSTQMSAVYNVVGTVASGAAGVKLPATETGALCFVANDDSTDTLTVYPATSSTIDGSASTTIAAGKRRFFVGTSATTWVSLLGA
jgi:hypothetical protein